MDPSKFIAGLKLQRSGRAHRRQLPEANFISICSSLLLLFASICFLQYLLCALLDIIFDMSYLRRAASADASEDNEPSSATSFFAHRYLDIPILDNTTAFRICFGVLLLVLILAQLKIFVGILSNRHKPTMRLNQPIALAIFLFSGMITTASCYLTLPSSDVTCALRDPFLLVSLSLSGSTLMARSWRVEVLLCPSLNAGADVKPGVISNSNMRSLISKTKNFLIKCCDGIVDWQTRCSTCTCSRWKQLCRKPSVSATSVPSSSKGLRRTVSVSSLLFLIVVLCLPQLTLQILNISIGSMRETRTIVLDGHLGISMYECQRSLGTGITWLGAILAIIPYFATFVLSVPSSAMPPIFDELRFFKASLSTSAIVVSVGAPGYAMALGPDAAAFLLSTTILCAPLSLCWYLGRAKLDLVRSGTRSGSINLRREPEQDEERRDGGKRSFADFEKAASLALELGGMFSAMGQKDKEIEVYDDALSKLDSEGSEKKIKGDRIGGFLKKDIECLEAKALKLLLKLLVAKGRVLTNYSYTEFEYHLRGSAVMMDAIDVFEAAPASHLLAKDRGILLPCYSLLYQNQKILSIKPNLEVEQRLSKLFLRDSKTLALPYFRALSLASEVSGRMGKYDEAVHIVKEKIQTIYSPSVDSELLVKEFMTDKCAQAIALTAFWYLCRGDIEDSLKCCDYIINDLIPKMYQGSANSFWQILYPLIAVYQHLDWPDGKAELCLELFQKRVVGVFYQFEGKDGMSPCKAVFNPVPIYLRLCASSNSIHYEGMESDVTGVLDGFDNDNIFLNCLDNLYSNTSWSLKTAVAESCYLLAMRLGPESKETKRNVVRKGLEIAKKSAQNLKDSHNEIPIVLETNQKVLMELEELAVELLMGPDCEGAKSTSFKEEEEADFHRLSSYVISETEETSTEAADAAGAERKRSTNINMNPER